MIIERQFSSQGHVIRLAVEKGITGWNVQEEFDSAIVHVQHCDDWHRVERAMGRLEMQALQYGLADHVPHR